MTDFFDPNTWTASQHEYRIYLDDNANQYCIVDEEDYLFFCRWRWHVNKPHGTRNGKKEYACRNTGRPNKKLYLHVEIKKRSGAAQPTPLHRLVDHLDGNEFNCRRSNLQWATPRQNRANLFGCGAVQVCLEL